jgi:hypothetical protein
MKRKHFIELSFWKYGQPARIIVARDLPADGGRDGILEQPNWIKLC